MASVEITDTLLADPSILDPYRDDVPVKKLRRGIRGIRWGRGIILILAAAYFIVPFYAAMVFSLQKPTGGFSLQPLTQIASAPGFLSALWLSTRLAVITMVGVMLLMVPTVIYVHLRMPRFRRVMEVITILPIIIPPIAYATGVLESAPAWLRASPYLLAIVYVILAMPFVYRSLDSGLGALDLKTLVEASRSLGSGWVSTIWRVLVPNLRAALMSASVLTIALVFGEFTIANVDNWTTIPVWVYLAPTDNPRINTLVAMIALLATILVLTLIVSLDRSQSRNTRRS
jgi:putative spermidine/putrescine transport system permease protein